jgi:hypothetical protein
MRSLKALGDDVVAFLRSARNCATRHEGTSQKRHHICNARDPSQYFNKSPKERGLGSRSCWRRRLHELDASPIVEFPAPNVKLNGIEAIHAGDVGQPRRLSESIVGWPITIWRSHLFGYEVPREIEVDVKSGRITKIRVGFSEEGPVVAPMTF